MTGTDIATIDGASYLALNRSSDDLRAIIRDNLAGDVVGEFDLPRLKVPSGGGSHFEVPSLTGIKAEAEVSGIVVFVRQGRAYWESDDATGEPPNCVSRDNIVGVGDPGGDCASCPFSQFESDPKNGRGQACKQQAMWFLLLEESFLPIVLTLPPTSLKAGKSYMLALANAGVRASTVVTTIGLEQDKSAGGDKFSRIVPKLGARLDPGAAERAAQYADAMRPTFEAAPVVETAAAGGNGKKPPKEPVAAAPTPTED